MAYEWDRNKASSNQTKHCVTFEEAKSVFEEDVNTLTLSDVEHSFEEERYIEIGMSGQTLCKKLIKSRPPSHPTI